jgi:acyl carrier protein
MDTISLLDLIAGTFAVPPAEITEETSMENTKRWDSLRHLILMTELETRYGIELSDAEMTAATSVAKIRAALKAHGIE